MHVCLVPVNLVLSTCLCYTFVADLTTVAQSTQCRKTGSSCDTARSSVTNSACLSSSQPFSGYEPQHIKHECQPSEGDVKFTAMGAGEPPSGHLYYLKDGEGAKGLHHHRSRATERVEVLQHMKGTDCQEERFSKGLCNRLYFPLSPYRNINTWPHPLSAQLTPILSYTPSASGSVTREVYTKRGGWNAKFFKNLQFLILSLLRGTKPRRCVIGTRRTR